MCHVGQEPATELADRAERRPATLGPLLSKTNASDETRLRQKIKEGSRLMPGYKHTLTDEQIAQVIAFMKTIERPLTRLAVARAGEEGATDEHTTHAISGSVGRRFRRGSGLDFLGTGGRGRDPEGHRHVCERRAARRRGRVGAGAG